MEVIPLLYLLTCPFILLVQISVLYHFRNIQKADNYFVMAVILFEMLFTFYTLINSCILIERPWFIQNEVYCQISGFLTAYFQSAAFLTVMFTTINPILVIIFHRKPLSKNWIFACLAFTSLAPILFASAPLYHYPLTKYRTESSGVLCWFDMTKDGEFFVIRGAMVVMIVLISTEICLVPLKTGWMWYKMEQYRKARLDTSESKMEEYQWIVAKKGSLITVSVLMGYLPMVILHILEYVYSSQLSKFSHALVLAALALSWFLNPIFVTLSEKELFVQAQQYVQALKNIYPTKSSQPEVTQLETIKG